MRPQLIFYPRFVFTANVDIAVVPFIFDALPLGSIKPRGWLLDQMQLMAAGLAGHEHGFYHYVANSSWLGGDQEYSELNEGFPYWFNGLVPLAYGVDDDCLKTQVQGAADYVLGAQATDGWLGPENGTARNFWARYPLCLGLMQLAEVDPAYEERVISALWKFTDLMHSMLADNYTGYLYHDGDKVSQDDTQWGRVRVQDMIITLQWLYEKHPPPNASVLLDNMQYLIDGSLNWDEWYQEGIYITQDLNTVPVSETIPLFPYEHGVNVGQGLKALAVFRRFTHNDSLLETTRNAVNWTFTYHGAASGAILADERLAGLAPYYGSETCTLVETMYSLGYLYQAVGDNDFADKCERTAFNALPVQLTPDWWARQYVSEPNQPYSEDLSDKPFWNVNNWGQTYGLETDYPCCTVNHPQGYPKFLSASYVKVGDNGLAHVLLSPASVSSTLSSGNVMVDCTTNYPFANIFSYTTTSTPSFDFYVHVPQWANLASSTIATGNTTTPLSPDLHTGLHKLSLSAGTTSATLTLNTDIAVELRANDTVAVHYGALIYALSIPSTNTSTLPKAFNTNQEFPSSYAPPQSRDWQLTNTSAWNIAIDPSTLTLNTANRSAGALPNPIWAPGAPPTSMSVRACEIAWGIYKGVPDVPPPKAERKCLGDVFEARLEPLGAAKLHMVDLPSIDLSGA